MKKILLLLLSAFPFLILAGGNNDQVRFPTNHKEDFIHYDTRNRVNGTQIVDLYANETALRSADTTASGHGSIVVMEIYKAVTEDDGKPVTTESGLFEKGKFAAVAVMEKRADWGDAYPAAERSGDWGFGGVEVYSLY